MACGPMPGVGKPMAGKVSGTGKVIPRMLRRGNNIARRRASGQGPDRRQGRRGVLESLAANPRIASVMAQRATLMAATEANAQAVFAPRDPGGLSVAARLAFAERIAELNGDASLAAHYHARQAAAPGEDGRLEAMRRHVELVTAAPRQATQADITALPQAGVADSDIVRLSQLIAFVNYQVRLLAGLRLIGGAA